MIDGRVEYSDITPHGDEYRLDITFSDGQANAREKYVVGYFGMNVSFEGEYHRVEDRVINQDRFQRILHRIMPEVAQVTGVRVDEIGLHVWLIQQGRGYPSPALVRVARARLSDATPSRQRRWHQGEGVVGLCWQQQDDVAVDLSNPALDVTSTEEWDALPAALRQGLSLTDFRATTHFFKAICASPIVPAFETVGCVSLNYDRECQPAFSDLWNSAVKRLLRRAAEDVAMQLRGS